MHNLIAAQEANEDPSLTLSILETAMHFVGVLLLVTRHAQRPPCLAAAAETGAQPKIKESGGESGSLRNFLTTVLITNS